MTASAKARRNWRIGHGASHRTKPAARQAVRTNSSVNMVSFPIQGSLTFPNTRGRTLHGTTKMGAIRAPYGSMKSKYETHVLHGPHVA